MKTLNKDLAAIQLNQVIKQLGQYDKSNLIDIYNDYASMNSYEQVYNNDEDTINEMYTNAYDAIKETNHSGYSYNDEYFTYNGYGLMVSFNYLIDVNYPIDINELAQWLINEDKLSEYDITVVTLDDMLASIEDNISDNEMLLNTVCQYLHLNHITLGNEYSFDEKLNISMELINGFNYEQLNKLITDLNINYQ